MDRVPRPGANHPAAVIPAGLAGALRRPGYQDRTFRVWCRPVCCSRRRSSRAHHHSIVRETVRRTYDSFAAGFFLERAGRRLAAAAGFFAAAFRGAVGRVERAGRLPLPAARASISAVVSMIDAGCGSTSSSASKLASIDSNAASTPPASHDLGDRFRNRSALRCTGVGLPLELASLEHAQAAAPIALHPDQAVL